MINGNSFGFYNSLVQYVIQVQSLWKLQIQLFNNGTTIDGLCQPLIVTYTVSIGLFLYLPFCFMFLHFSNQQRDQLVLLLQCSMVWDISFGDWARPRKLCTAMTARYATWGLCEEDFEGISLQEFETAESRIPLLSEYKQGITLNPPFDFHHQNHQCCNDVTLIYSMPIKIFPQYV